MHTYLSAAAANCSTGTWQQKWNCGWNQPATGAAHAGQVAGHAMSALIVLAVIIAIVMLAKKTKRAGRAAPAKTAARR
jgi:hypothetical protein